MDNNSRSFVSHVLRIYRVLNRVSVGAFVCVRLCACACAIHVLYCAECSISDEDLKNLFSLARHGRSKKLKELLDKGVPPDVRDRFGNTVLLVACQNGNKKIAKAVLRKGADINAKNVLRMHSCFGS